MVDYALHDQGLVDAVEVQSVIRVQVDVGPQDRPGRRVQRERHIVGQPVRGDFDVQVALELRGGPPHSALGVVGHRDRCSGQRDSLPDLRDGHFRGEVYEVLPDPIGDLQQPHR